ncbi:hypothetical protein LSAT2_030225 [Lamellibrachia satsuma]|nr:hypothetical protein LSAT2_030225 [Lamellibrachia satsuma]
MKACQDGQGAHSGETEYYLAHPNTCNKYIRCFSSGNDGVEQRCAVTLLSFNPDHTGTADVCKHKNEVPQCNEDLTPRGKIPCSEVICENGATCTDTDIGYRCDCVAGYTGSLCETDGIAPHAFTSHCTRISLAGARRRPPGVSAVNHPMLPQVSHLLLEWAIDANVTRLYWRRQTAGDYSNIDVAHGFSCSSLSPTADCSFGRLDAMKACQDVQGAHSGETEYYLAHPNTCSKYIRCFSSGNDGVEQPCAATFLSFNPDYTDTADVCKDKNEVPQCKRRPYPKRSDD